MKKTAVCNTQLHSTCGFALYVITKFVVSRTLLDPAYVQRALSECFEILPLPQFPYPGRQRFLAARFVTCGRKAARCRPRPTNKRRSREKTSGVERLDLLFSLNFDHSYRITFKPITANISYCDHMHQHVKIRQI